VTEFSWTVIHVRSTGDDPPGFEEFAYTEGLVANEEMPNLWLSYRGACGHRLGYEMAHYLVNETAQQLIDHGVAPGGAVDGETAAGGIIRVRVGDPVGPREGEQLEAFPSDGAPIIPLSWTCSLDADWAPQRK
jgi:hypothetical protein